MTAPDIATLRQLLADADLPWTMRADRTLRTPDLQIIFDDSYQTKRRGLADGELIEAVFAALPGLLDRVEAAEATVAQVEALAIEEATYCTDHDCSCDHVNGPRLRAVLAGPIEGDEG